MPTTDPAARVAALTDDALAALHGRLDAQLSTVALASVPATVEAHHLVAVEMMKRGMSHGHDGDELAEAVIVVEEVQVASADDIEAPEGMEEVFAKALAGGGTVSVTLTVDGFVLKADPTVNEVHVDSIMGSKRRRRPMDKAREWEVDDFVTWGSSGGDARGRIERIVSEGSLNVPDSSFSIKAQPDDPAVLIRVYRLTSQGFRPTDRLVGHKASTLRSIGALTKADGAEVPADVRAAARQALEWIADGRAGDGFTSVGRNRAKQLAEGGTVGRETLVKMRAYFARHIVDKDAKDWGDKSNPTPGMVAWYAWGGDPGRRWANEILGPVKKGADYEETDADEEELLSLMDEEDLAGFRAIALTLEDVEKAGNPEALRDYWRSGGKGKVNWGGGGDFTACVAAVGKYMTNEEAKGYCAIRHREVTGMWPGDKRNRARKSVDGDTGSMWSFAMPDGSTVTYQSFSHDGSSAAPIWKHMSPGDKGYGAAHPQSKVNDAGGGKGSGEAKGRGKADVPAHAPDLPIGHGGARTPEAAAEATALRARAEKVEPEITATMMDIADSTGGTMEGLEQRLKSTDSLARKIDADAEAAYGGDRAAAAADISDAVRYTAVVPDDQYTEAVGRTIETLEDQGYTVRAKNFWEDGDAYQGVNMKATKNGLTVELQLHTPTSLDVKEGRSTKPGPERSLHDSYETYRTSRDTRTRWQAWSGMVRLARQIPKPQNYRRLLGLGTRVRERFTTGSGVQVAT